MKRSIEFPCDKRWVKNPTNNPIATIGQRMAASARTKKAIAAVQAILSAHFTPPPLSRCDRTDERIALRDVLDRMTAANHWTVRLTRISPGTLDPLTGGASMKTIQDAVARWCGVPDERNPIWTWVEPIGQEKRGQGVYGVRIEIESLEPGQDRIVRLKGVEAREPKVKRGRPTVGDLRDAAARALSKPRASDGCHERPEIVRALDQIDRGPDPTPSRRALEREAGAFSRDPGEERAACMVKPCETCGAAIGGACADIPGAAKVYGVHVRRAAAAGVLNIADLRTPARVLTGSRKLATVRPVECWARLPWRTWPESDLVPGDVLARLREDAAVRWKAAEEKAAEEKGAPGELVMEIAPDHKAAWRTMCKACVGQGCNTCGRVGRTHKFRMIRRPWRRAGVECWLYEPAT